MEFTEQRATRIILIVLVGLLLSWLPFFIALMCRYDVPFAWNYIKTNSTITATTSSSYAQQTKSCPLSQSTLDGLTWLGFAHSAIFNPLVNFVFNTEFKEAFRRHCSRWVHTSSRPFSLCIK